MTHGQRARCAVYFTTIFNLARKIPPESASMSQASNGGKASSEGIQACFTLQVIVLLDFEA
jgi:hypothetical protein